MSLRTEYLAVLLAIYFALFNNRLYWDGAMAGQSLAHTESWIFAVCLLVFMVAAHSFLFLLMFNRWTARWLAAVLIVATAFASYYMEKYQVYLDSSMIRNVLKTDVKEASELFNWGMILPLLTYSLPGLFLLSLVRIKRSSFVRALFVRLGALILTCLVAALSVIPIFQDYASLNRNQPALRFLVTPGNYLYGLARVLTDETQSAVKVRVPVGQDAKLSLYAAKRTKPVLVVMVVGETARAANWGLNGYSRQTTPELARMGVLNFQKTSSCGTNTEVSVPCMFSAVGRRDYDEDRIRGSESLLHVVRRAGVATLWRDNQSGCKGVCADTPEERFTGKEVPELCDGERCLDAILAKGLNEIVLKQPGDMLIALHQLGNHGPAYYRRYPSEFSRFQPTCDSSDLRACSRESVVNAYDNALLYTDHVLASLIKQLDQLSDQRDIVVIYASDHGESLGEKGLYLHGVPRSIAPSEQTHVPMIMWFSKGFEASQGLSLQCMQHVAALPSSHDNLFHTILGILGVETQVYEKSLDLMASCRK